MSDILSWGDEAVDWETEHRSQYTYVAHPIHFGVPPMGHQMQSMCAPSPSMGHSAPPVPAEACFPPGSAPASGDGNIPAEHDVKEPQQMMVSKQAVAAPQQRQCEKTASTHSSSRPPFHNYGRNNTKPAVRLPSSLASLTFSHMPCAIGGRLRLWKLPGDPQCHASTVAGGRRAATLFGGRFSAKAARGLQD